MTASSVPVNDHVRLLALETKLVQFSDALCETTTLIARFTLKHNLSLEGISKAVEDLKRQVRKLEDRRT